MNRHSCLRRSLLVRAAVLIGLLPTSPVWAQKMYWADGGGAKIQRSDLDGTNVETLISSGVGAPWGLALDAGNQKMYWTDQSTNKIQRANMDGTGGIEDLVSHSQQPQPIALDLANGHMYVGFFDNVVRRFNLNGTGETPLVTTGNFPRGLALDLLAGHIYMGLQNVPSLIRTNLSGGGLTTLISGGLSCPIMIALDTPRGHMYWIERCSPQAIRRANLNGLGMTNLVTSGMSNPYHLTLDLNNDKLYWTDQGNGTIKRADITGANIETLVSGLGGPYGIALDFTMLVDCNLNAVADELDIAGPTSADCNTNLVPDECDIASTTSDDCDANAVPDECDPDCNSNGLHDRCVDIAGATSDDCTGNGIPDECEAGQWIGADGANFDDGANWTGGVLPSSLAQLSNAGPTDNRAVLNTPGTTDVCAVSIQASGSGRQALRIDGGAVLSCVAGITVLAGGDLSLRGGAVIGGVLINESNSIDGYGLIDMAVNNQGTLRGQTGRTLDVTGSSFTNAVAGSLQLPIGATVFLQSGVFTQQGDIEVRTNSVLALGAALSNEPGATLTLLNGSLGANGFHNAAGASFSGFGTIDSDVDNEGNMTLIADTHILGNLNNDGTITIQSGILTITGNLSGGGVIIGGFGG